MRLPDDIEIGVFGGTGLYSLLSNPQELVVDTPFGEPSGPVSVGEMAGRKVAFLPRHGSKHTIPPHEVPYRANVQAMKMLGVKRIIAPTACGSLQQDIHPGELVVTDQFVDRTWGRPDTFFDGPEVVHISAAHPYCPELCEIACNEIERFGIGLHRSGVCVVIQGPRFSTCAESRFYSEQGWHTINMTQYPEVVLAREAEICYVNIALVTDYDSGLSGGPGTPPATAAQVVATLKQGDENVRRVIEAMVAKIPARPACRCSRSLEDSSL